MCRENHRLAEQGRFVQREEHLRGEKWKREKVGGGHDWTRMDGGHHQLVFMSGIDVYTTVGRRIEALCKLDGRKRRSSIQVHDGSADPTLGNYSSHTEEEMGWTVYRNVSLMLTTRRKEIYTATIQYNLNLFSMCHTSSERSIPVSWCTQFNCICLSIVRWYSE